MNHDNYIKINNIIYIKIIYYILIISIHKYSISGTHIEWTTNSYPTELQDPSTGRESYLAQEI